MVEINKQPLPDQKKKTTTRIPGGRIQPPVNVIGNPIADNKADLAAKHHNPHNPVDQALEKMLGEEQK